jgi:hypothetical protein
MNEQNDTDRKADEIVDLTFKVADKMITRYFGGIPRFVLLIFVAIIIFKWFW